MPGGAYSALSGMRTRLDELDRLAADLANINTPGYKAERAASEVAERNAFSATLASAVDVLPGGTKVDFTPGVIAATGRDLDVAIDGRGFFVIETPRGLRYTRAGNFLRNADGVLTTPDGHPVMGDGGEIRVPPGRVTIGADGTIRSGDVVAGRLQVVDFESERDLIRESGARFRALPGAPDPGDVERVRVVGGSLEQSNVAVVDRMVKLTELSRNFESLNKGVNVLMTELDSRAISDLLRR